MRITRMFIATGFLAILAIFTYYSFYFKDAGVNGIVALEFADAAEGRDILASWQDHHLLMLGRTLTWIDFIYIFFYVAVIITLSNRQVRKEPSIQLNALLRANFFFAVLAGLLDIIENICLLYDMYHIGGSTYVSPCWLALFKFILVGWAIVVWLVSFVKARVS